MSLSVLLAMLQLAASEVTLSLTLQIVNAALTFGTGAFTAAVTIRLGSLRKKVERIEAYLIRQSNLPPGVL